MTDRHVRWRPHEVGWPVCWRHRDRPSAAVIEGTRASQIAGAPPVNVTRQACLECAERAQLRIWQQLLSGHTPQANGDAS